MGVKGQTMTGRLAFTLVTRPGADADAAQGLLDAFPVQPGGPQPAGVRSAATFVAPGRVVQVLDTTYELPRLVETLHPHQRAGIEARLRACCPPGAVPTGGSLSELLAGGEMAVRAHFVATPDSPGSRPVHRRALLYPVRAQRGDALAGMLGAGVAPSMPAALAAGLMSSTILARGDVVVRFWEACASAAEELAHISRIVPRSGLGARLNDLLDFDQDLTTEEGFRVFFTRCALRPVAKHGHANRRSDQPT
jgi:hypothetical protein